MDGSRCKVFRHPSMAHGERWVRSQVTQSGNWCSRSSVLSPSMSRFGGIVAFCQPPADAGTQFRRRCLWRDDEEGDSRLRSQRAEGSAPGARGRRRRRSPTSRRRAVPVPVRAALVGEFAGLPGINAAVHRRVRCGKSPRYRTGACVRHPSAGAASPPPDRSAAVVVRRDSCRSRRHRG
jgi:hypothetical protein